MSDAELSSKSVLGTTELSEAQKNSNLDRLEKKKNREKRRRSEVNERFDELIEVMEKSQAQLMNAPPFASDLPKGTLTKAGLLEKAVDLVKLLAEENKKLKMMVQNNAQPMPTMLPPFSFDRNMNWMAVPHGMPGYGGSVMPNTMGMAGPVDFGLFKQPQQQLQLPGTGGPLAPPPVGYNGKKTTILSHADMVQLGEWTTAPKGNFHLGSSENPVGYEKSNQAHQEPAMALLSTHAECA